MKLKVLISLIVLLIIDIILILTGVMDRVDSVVYDFIFSFNSEGLTEMFKTISLLASAKLVIFYNIIIIIIMIIEKSNKLVLVPISSLISAVINNIIKIIVARERPGINPLVMELTYSFPSGHSMIAILFFGTLLYIINKNNNKFKKIFNVIIPIFILSIGISRIYLGVHYFSDCISGYLIAGIILIILIMLGEKYESISYRSK